MKITFFASGNVRSNFSYRILALAKSLHKIGYDVSIVAPSADKYNDFIPEKITIIDGVRILQPFQFNTRRLEINLIPYLFGTLHKLIKEKPDLVYIYKPTPISIVGLFAKYFWRTTVVVDFDDLGSDVMKIEGHPLYQRKLVEWSERLVAYYADRIVVASTYLFDLYHKKFSAKPIHIMSNGVDGEWFKEPLAHQTEKRIVFMGSLNRKNILEPLFDVLPNILKSIPKTQVLIMGDGKYLAYFKQKSSSLNLNEHVAFTGWLELSKARAHLSEGDIGYNYMPNETTVLAASNMKIPQYMSRGVVPLVSDIGDMPAMVDAGRGGYIAKADDLEALETTLLNALNDPGRSAKAEKARNFALEKFNWDTLALGFHRWVNPQKAGGRKKIYFVAVTVPDTVGGSEIRNYNLLRQLAKQKNTDTEVFSISPRDIKADTKKFESRMKARIHIAAEYKRTPITALRAIVMHGVPPYMDVFESIGIGKMFRKACEASMPDIVQIEQLDAYYCIRPHIPWLKRNGVNIVFDCHNVEHQAFKDSLDLFSLSKKVVGTFLVPSLERMEIEAATQADAIFACSAHDVDFFKTYNPKTYLVPNGVEHPLSDPIAKKDLPLILFIGGVGYPPNGDGLEFYLTSVHPFIRTAIPHVQLLAIGATPEWLASKGIHDATVKPLGFVGAIQPYLDQAIVGICPIRYGSGTRIKIMTYMAAGLPVVSTVKGAEGVMYTNGHDIILADDPKEFADAVVKFLSDRTYRDKIAKNGRNFILKHYDWDVIGETLNRAYPQ